MSTLLIIGASRGIGLASVKAGLAAGHTIRALARSALSIPITDPRLTKIDGDATDPATLAKALPGSDAVIQSLGIALDFTSVMRGTLFFSSATRALIDAMVAMRPEGGPDRLVAVTGAGAGDSRGRLGLAYDTVFFPLLLARIYDDKDVQEQMIKASPLDWTILRPGGLTNGPASGKPPQAITDPARYRAGFISRADVAEFLVREAFARAYVRQTPMLIG